MNVRFGYALAVVPGREQMSTTLYDALIDKAKGNSVAGGVEVYHYENKPEADLLASALMRAGHTFLYTKSPALADAITRRQFAQKLEGNGILRIDKQA